MVDRETAREAGSVSQQLRQQDLALLYSGEHSKREPEWIRNLQSNGKEENAILLVL